MHQIPPIIPSTKKWRRVTAVMATVALSLGVFSVQQSSADTEVDASASTVVYVEVNSNDFSHVADYSLVGTDLPAFDIGVIFAANINYEDGAAQLHLNDRVTETLTNADTQIRPVQERGTKVLLSILGNHQGAGFANFEDYADADAFAAQLEAVVEEYGLDGIDFDDEWSDYGTNDTSQPNASSFVYLVHALRNRLGDEKLITFYDIGPSSDATEYKHMYAGDLLNYAWNPYYGSWKPPVIEHMSADRLGAAAVDLSRTSAETTTMLAQKTVDEGYGMFVTYNLTDANQEEFISLFTSVLKGRNTYNTKFPDTTRPEVVLNAPTDNAVVNKLEIIVSATDNRDLSKIVANIYQGGKLVKSTQTKASGTSATHTASVDLPDGVYQIRYNARDSAGNLSRTHTANVTLDTVLPEATIKTGESFTVQAEDGAYTLISFKLFDAGQVDKVTLNGVTKDLNNNTWSDLNHVKAGVYGAVSGANTLTLHDVAGNLTTMEFTLS